MSFSKLKNIGLQFFAEPKIISRTDLSGLIPEPVTREIIQGVSQGSAVLQMGRRLPNMTSKTQSMNVLDMLPTAFWVDTISAFMAFSSVVASLRCLIKGRIRY